MYRTQHTTVFRLSVRHRICRVLSPLSNVRTRTSGIIRVDLLLECAQTCGRMNGLEDVATGALTDHFFLLQL